MYFNSKDLSPRQVYSLLIGLVAPRPIALVTTLGPDGLVNAAPYSAFNYMGAEPPLVVLGVQNKAGTDNEPKDTARNIRKSGEFVINIVTEEIGEKMNICAIDFPSDVSEIKMAGFTTTSSQMVKVPRIAESKAALECREVSTVEIGRNRIVIGEVLAFYVEDKFVDTSGPYIKSEDLNALGRMNGLGSYVKTRDAFIKIPRLSLKDFKK